MKLVLYLKLNHACQQFLLLFNNLPRVLYLRENVKSVSFRKSGIQSLNITTAQNNSQFFIVVETLKTLLLCCSQSQYITKGLKENGLWLVIPSLPVNLYSPPPTNIIFIRNQASIPPSCQYLSKTCLQFCTHPINQCLNGEESPSDAILQIALACCPCQKSY